MRFLGLSSLPWAAPSRSTSAVGRWIEAALVLALAIQLARLFWVMLAPPAAFGDWRPFQPVVPPPQARISLFSAFDPFYRTAGAATSVQQVTSLPFTLYGIRVNEGSGLGSAIIADETGVQISYAVGEEIAPGVVLTAVNFDHVTISRGGVEEALYIDQSGDTGTADVPEGAPVVDVPPAGATVAPPAVGSPDLSPQAIVNGIAFAPRTENGQVTGIVLSPQGGDDVFARAGFRPGDIVAQINGSPVRTTQDLVNLRSLIKPGARLTLMVERGAATVPIAIIIPDTQ